MRTHFLLTTLSALLGNLALAADFSLSSPDLQAGTTLPMAQVANDFGCHGGNIQPALQWDNPPAGTQSYAITVYDPDAPTGSGWWHWLAFNLPANTRSLPSNASAEHKLPAGTVETRTDVGYPGFFGACPPVGDKPHRYIFTVHALKVPKLDLPVSASGALVGYMINANQISKASFTMHYSR
ncbi:YbhB/YbcL family Raf kinase inhibitor-like protein [Leeia aquatica]|uniref:YbhB/YbcL family Raf kinase inhibitor-like protein n=1 Tax=Leeia aquatica TaxID=2725557 RepID=A0A847SI40_9NEIS|nr:YbhB/YbcL family Raf kinase inhibitor-like protein [Leeia aquatica]NLR75542.1 YbhB/YbcL family Raf kinase inhibitor-like protein [Leeia aquatica]